MTDMVFIFKIDRKHKVRQQVAKLVDAGYDFVMETADNGLDYRLVIDKDDAKIVTEIGNDCSIWVKGGTVTMDSGEKAQLREMQGILNQMFTETGDMRLAAVSNELSIITGLVQGPHEEWEERG